MKSPVKQVLQNYKIKFQGQNFSPKPSLLMSSLNFSPSKLNVNLSQKHIRRHACMYIYIYILNSSQLLPVNKVKTVIFQLHEQAIRGMKLTFYENLLFEIHVDLHILYHLILYNCYLTK